MCLFIHYQLTYKQNLLENNELDLFIDNINLISKQVSKLHRTINLRKSLKALPSLSKHFAKVVDINDKYLVLLISKIGKFKYYLNEYIDIKLNKIIEIELGIVNDFYCNKMVIIKTQFDLSIN